MSYTLKIVSVNELVSSRKTRTLVEYTLTDQHGLRAQITVENVKGQDPKDNLAQGKLQAALVLVGPNDHWLQKYVNKVKRGSAPICVRKGSVLVVQEAVLANADLSE